MRLGHLDSLEGQLGEHLDSVRDTVCDGFLDFLDAEAGLCGHELQIGFKDCSGGGVDLLGGHLVVLCCLGAGSGRLSLRFNISQIPR